VTKFRHLVTVTIFVLHVLIVMHLLRQFGPLDNVVDYCKI